jgi:hypothetical protein
MLMTPANQYSKWECLCGHGFDWVAGSMAPAQAITATLSLQTTGFNSRSAQSTTFSDAEGRAGASQALGTGIVVKPGEQLCVSFDPPAVAPGLFGFIGTARGFFVPDR